MLITFEVEFLSLFLQFFLFSSMIFSILRNFQKHFFIYLLPRGGTPDHILVSRQWLLVTESLYSNYVLSWILEIIHMKYNIKNSYIANFCRFSHNTDFINFRWISHIEMIALIQDIIRWTVFSGLLNFHWEIQKSPAVVWNSRNQISYM